MFQPRLEVAGTGFDDGARIEAVRREPRNRGLGEIVKRGEVVFARWPDVDMRSVGIAVLEECKPAEYRGGGNAVEAGQHPAITHDTDIVERRLNCREHIANCGFGFVHRDRPSNLFCLGWGAGEGTGPAARLRVGESWHLPSKRDERGIC